MTIRLDPDHDRGPLLTLEYADDDQLEVVYGGTTPGTENIPTLEVGLAIPAKEATPGKENIPTLEVGLAIPAKEPVSKFSMQYQIVVDPAEELLLEQAHLGSDIGLNIYWDVTLGEETYLVNMRTIRKTATISVDASALQADNKPLISTLASAGETQLESLESKLRTSRLDRDQKRLDV